MCQITDYSPHPEPLPARDDPAWRQAAIASLLAEQAGCAATPMHSLMLPGFPDIGFRLKDESAHPSGSLKHRLARSLLLHALREGRVRRGQPLVDASSGSTAISEAWFARRLGLPFFAVMPCNTSRAKQDAVAALDGKCVLVESDADAIRFARRLARDMDGCFLDQFGLASTASGRHGTQNVAAELLQQSHAMDGHDPSWIVCGAGTGGTSGTIGRHLHHVGSRARVCVADPSGAAFARGWRSRDRDAEATQASCIEGIGRRRVEPCFDFESVHAIAQVDDAASIAAIWWLEREVGRRYGGSSGTNLAAAFQLAATMKARGERGTIVLLLCDLGERYADTVYSPAWVARQGLEPGRWLRSLERTARTGAAIDTAQVSERAVPWWRVWLPVAAIH